MLILVASVLAVFVPVTFHSFGFLTWDDFPNVATNPRFNPTTLHNIWLFWRRPYLSMYIPLTYTLWGLMAIAAEKTPDAAGHLDPSLFHLANFVLHIIAAWVVYRLLLCLVRHPWAALGGAILFAVHPVQVEPVAWVTGLKDGVSGLFCLIALREYVAFAQSSINTEATSVWPKYVHYGVATIAFVLAMLSKPSAVAAPLVALILDLLAVRRKLRAVILSILPWLLLVLPFVYIARLAQPVNLSRIDGGRVWLRPLLAGDALAFYLYKLVFPLWLIPQYDHSAKTAIARGWIYWAWLVPATLAIIAWVIRRRFPWAITAILILIAGTAPVLGFVPFSFEELSLVADRYLYVAMLGPALALAFVLAQFRTNRVVIWICAACLLLLGARSFQQTFYWKDSFTFAFHELDVNPRSMIADSVLADAYLAAGDSQNALLHARRAIERDPSKAIDYFTMGATLAATGKTDDAIEWIRKGLQIEPNNPIALGDLANLYAQKGDFAEAMRLSRKILSDHPDDSQAHFNLAVMLSQQHRDDEAIHEFQLSLESDPRNPQAHTYLGTLLAEKGQLQQAADHFRAALDADPDYGPAKQALARLR